jgi:hypothetical protein
MPPVPSGANPAWSIELVREIAMDIGKEVAAHIETMYPAAVEATGKTMLRSVRGCVFNEIIAALYTTEENAIRAKLQRRQALRRARKAAFRRKSR